MRMRALTSSHGISSCASLLYVACLASWGVSPVISADCSAQASVADGNLLQVRSAVSSQHKLRTGTHNEASFHPASPNARLRILINTGGPDSQVRMDSVRQTWASKLPANWSISLLQDRTECSAQYDPKTEGHWRHLTCRGAHQFWDLRDEDFDWLLVIDDDAYVHVQNFQSILRGLSLQEHTVHGVPGCVKNTTSLCGGSGYLLNRLSFNQMTSGELGTKESFISAYMAEPDSIWVDVRFGCVARRQQLGLKLMHGMYGNPLDDVALRQALDSTEVPPLIFHYVTPALMSQIHNDINDPGFVRTSFTKKGRVGISMAEYLDLVDAFVHSSERRR